MTGSRLRSTAVHGPKQGIVPVSCRGRVGGQLGRERGVPPLQAAHGCNQSLVLMPTGRPAVSEIVGVDQPGTRQLQPRRALATLLRTGHVLRRPRVHRRRPVSPSTQLVDRVSRLGNAVVELCQPELGYLLLDGGRALHTIPMCGDRSGAVSTTV